MQIIEKLSVSAPSGEVKLEVLKEIAREYNLEWDSSISEAELSKKHEDLLVFTPNLSSMVFFFSFTRPMIIFCILVLFWMRVFMLRLSSDTLLSNLLYDPSFFVHYLVYEVSSRHSETCYQLLSFLIKPFKVFTGACFGILFPKIIVIPRWSVDVGRHVIANIQGFWILSCLIFTSFTSLLFCICTNIPLVQYLYLLYVLFDV